MIIVAQRQSQFHHHPAHNYRDKQGSRSGSAFLTPSSFSASLSQTPTPPLLSGIRCLLPPLGGCTDAGWRHSGLNLLLLMLMLKEAIGTCYFCFYPQLPGANKEVLIGRLIRHWMMAHRVLLKRECREKQTIGNKLLRNCRGLNET